MPEEVSGEGRTLPVWKKAKWFHENYDVPKSQLLALFNSGIIRARKEPGSDKTPTRYNVKDVDDWMNSLPSPREYRNVKPSQLMHGRPRKKDGE